MPRPSRIHVRGGLYYLTQFANRGQSLFSGESGYDALEGILARALERSGSNALAYCWLPDALHLVVQCGATPVSRFMQGFTSAYARHVHACIGESGHLFARRFQSVLLDPASLPELVRFIHHTPALAGLSTPALNYPHTSHDAYARSRRPMWLQTQAVFQALCQRGLSHSAAMQFLCCTPTEQDIAVFSSHERRDSRIVGNDAFLQSLPRALQSRRNRLDLDGLIEVVARSQGVSRVDLLCASRERHLSMCRALLAWHAMERRVASLSEVARVLRRDTSTLSKAITRYRSRKPELFRLDALQRFWPIA